jgi:hypothetical protein
MTGELDPGAAHTAAVDAIRKHAADLRIYLTIWAARDDEKAQPDVRQAANHAMDAIDAALRELYGIRSRLVGEIRASDDATAARVDELLRQCREERGQL